MSKTASRITQPAIASSSSAATTSLATLPPRLDQPQLIRLSPDLALALEDQWIAAGGGREGTGCKGWQEWLEDYVNQALQSFLGVC